MNVEDVAFATVKLSCFKLRSGLFKISASPLVALKSACTFTWAPVAIPVEERRLPEVYVFSEPRPREQQVEDGPLRRRPVRDAAVHRPLVVDQNVADGELRREDVGRLAAPLQRGLQRARHGARPVRARDELRRAHKAGHVHDRRETIERMRR